MNLVQAESLDGLASEAVRKCQKEPVVNLILHGVFPYEEVNSDFVKMNDEIAAKWQNPNKPCDLFINHGEYIHKYGNGQEFLVDELMRKKSSNRACLSLMNMADIIDSGDAPLPSFLILQFGLPKATSDKVLVTAYFRALEVSRFLPINLAEISQNIRFFKSRFTSIEYFELTIIAFRAHIIRGFHCLQKASLDIQDAVEITLAVDRRELGKLRGWLASKIAVTESIVCTAGLEVLCRALEKCGEAYDKSILVDVRAALGNMKRLREMRKATSNTQEINNLNKNIESSLRSAVKKLK